MTEIRSVGVIGGAGFIGSHVVDELLSRSQTERVVVYDNFTSGQEWHLSSHLDDERLEVVRGQASSIDDLTSALLGLDTVIHLASNPDVARAMTDPTIDFYEGTLLTHCVVESARRAGVGTLLYASGSGVYGEIGETAAWEDFGPLVPVSTYGASKLAGEALISSYCHMFGMRGAAFRFGNVVGPRQTHGVGYDFIRRLTFDPTRLSVLGDGSQSKSYIHVSDVIAAVFGVATGTDEVFRTYNVATGDYITVSEIARLAIDVLGLQLSNVQIEFTGGDRGWRGDVPVVRLDTSRIRSTGWRCRYPTSEALRLSLEAMLREIGGDTGESQRLSSS